MIATPLRKCYACRVLFVTEKGKFKNETCKVWAMSFHEATQFAIETTKRLKRRRMSIRAVTVQEVK